MKRYERYGYDGEAFTAYYYFIGYNHISFGFHFDLSVINLEIHLPFGFLRIGRKSKTERHLIKNLGLKAFKERNKLWAERTREALK